MAENVFFWSKTAADNDDADASVPWAEGMLPGSVNNSARGIMAGVARFRDDTNGTVATTGSANVYAITSNSSHTTYTDGTVIWGKANHTNTAAATLNLNTYGAKDIVVFGIGGETAVSAGQIQSGGTYQLRYDAAADAGNGAWVLLNPAHVTRTGTIEVWTTDTLPTGFLWANGEAVSRTTYAALFALIGETYGAGNGSTTFNVPDLCGRAPFGSDDMGGISAKGRITNAECSIVGTTLGASGGVQSVTLATTQIPAHNHGVTDPGHIHATTDPGHTHGISDSGHDHDTTDPGHTHTYTKHGAVNQQLGTSSAGAMTNPIGDNTGSNTTGISVNSATTGVTVDTAGTSLGVNSNTTGITTNNAGGGTSHSNMPPALVVNYIIKH